LIKNKETSIKRYYFLHLHNFFACYSENTDYLFEKKRKIIISVFAYNMLKLVFTPKKKEMQAVFILSCEFRNAWDSTFGQAFHYL